MSQPPTPAPEPHETEPVPLKTLVAQKPAALETRDSVETAGDRMREHDTAAWPVAEAQKLVGMIDEKNPDWKLGGHGHDPKSSKVRDIMKRELIFCYEDEDCASAQKLMEERGLRYLPVVDGQMRIVGIFSRKEIDEKADASGAATGGTARTAVHPATES